MYSIILTVINFTLAYFLNSILHVYTYNVIYSAIIHWGLYELMPNYHFKTHENWAYIQIKSSRP